MSQKKENISFSFATFANLNNDVIFGMQQHAENAKHQTLVLRFQKYNACQKLRKHIQIDHICRQSADVLLSLGHGVTLR